MKQSQRNSGELFALPEKFDKVQKQVNKKTPPKVHVNKKVSRRKEVNHSDLFIFCSMFFLCTAAILVGGLLVSLAGFIARIMFGG